jgi:hypothetical protein
MPRGQKIALEALKRVSAETTELFERLANISERATDRSSEVLVGVAGGATSLLLAYGVALAVPAVSFALAGPIAACIGLPLGILAWRGGRRFRIERETTETQLRIEAELATNRLKAEEILKRLKSLPKDAPQQVKDALYLEYLSLAAILRSGAGDNDEPPTPASLPPPIMPPLALPPPKLQQSDEKIPEPVRRTPKRKD